MKKTLFFYLASILLVSILNILVVSAQTNNCPMAGYGGMMSGYYGTRGLFFGWITSILVIVLIIAAIYWLIKSAQKKR